MTAEANVPEMPTPTVASTVAAPAAPTPTAPAASVPGAETEASLFGSAAPNTPPGALTQYPELVKLIRETALGRLKIPRDEFMRRYLSSVNSTAAQRMPPAQRYMAALRTVCSVWVKESTGQGSDYEFHVLRVGNAFKRKNDANAMPRPGQKPLAPGQTLPDEWFVTFTGLMHNLNDDGAVEGPVDWSVYGFPSQDQANKFASLLKPGRSYKIRARLTQKSPRGTLGRGQVGRATSNAGDRLPTPITPNGHATWLDPFARLEKSIPKVTFLDILSRPPKPRDSIRVVVECEVVRGSIGARKSDNQPFGSLSFTDLYLLSDAAAMKLTDGSVQAFLQPADFHYANDLAPGSIVTAILDVAGKKPKDDDTPSGELKLSDRLSFNLVALRVDSNLSGSDVTPEPGKVIADIAPTGPVPTVGDLLGDMGSSAEDDPNAGHDN
jgi:hypothetical protein